MRLVSFDDGSGARPGCLAGEGPDEVVVDIAAVASSHGEKPPASVGQLLELLYSGDSPLVEALRSACADPGGAEAATVPAGSFRLLAPLSPGAQVVCAGANYGDHLREMKGLRPPPSVIWFTKAPTSVVASGEPIVVPRHAAGMVDYEGELAVVIGKRCYRASQAEAFSFIGGYTIINDVSARDWVADALAATDPQEVRATWDKNLLGKQFPTFCPVGPAVVSADAVPHPERLHLLTRVNGTVMQDAWTDDLIVGIAELVSFLSQFMAFAPGDIISTGSPAGVGVARTPQVFLKPGDHVEVEVEGVGILANPVVAEESPQPAPG